MCYCARSIGLDAVDAEDSGLPGRLGSELGLLQHMPLGGQDVDDSGGVVTKGMLDVPSIVGQEVSTSGEGEASKTTSCSEVEVRSRGEESPLKKSMMPPASQREAPSASFSSEDLLPKLEPAISNSDSLLAESRGGGSTTGASTVVNGSDRGPKSVSKKKQGPVLPIGVQGSDFGPGGLAILKGQSESGQAGEPKDSGSKTQTGKSPEGRGIAPEFQGTAAEDLFSSQELLHWLDLEPSANGTFSAGSSGGASVPEPSAAEQGSAERPERNSQMERQERGQPSSGRGAERRGFDNRGGGNDSGAARAVRSRFQDIGSSTAWMSPKSPHQPSSRISTKGTPVIVSSVVGDARISSPHGYDRWPRSPTWGSISSLGLDPVHCGGLLCQHVFSQRVKGALDALRSGTVRGAGVRYMEQVSRTWGTPVLWEVHSAAAGQPPVLLDAEPTGCGM